MGKKRIIEKSEEELIKEAKEATNASAPVVKPVSKKKIMKEGRIYIYSSYNNTIITLTDKEGDVVFGASAGRVGFKGTKKSTPFAASKVADLVAQTALAKNITKVAIYVKGIGSGRDSAIRTLGTKGIEFTLIKDITPIPHNGPRKRRVRRA